MGHEASNDCDAASTRLFDVVELLENILFQLPLNDLLIVQRVNRTFRNVVLTSSTLCQKLYLVPGKGLKIATHITRVTTNPVRWSAIQRFQIFQSPPCCLNRPVDAHGLPLPLHYDHNSDTGEGLLELALRVHVRRSYNKDASWAKMFITQPPLKSVDVRVFYLRRGNRKERKIVHHWRRGNAMSESGITFGDVYRFAQQLASAGLDDEVVAVVTADIRLNMRRNLVGCEEGVQIKEQRRLLITTPAFSEESTKHERRRPFAWLAGCICCFR